MDRHFNFIISGMLAGILFMLIAIYIKMPNYPTCADFVKEKNDDTKKQLMLKRPIIVVEGSVGIEGNVSLQEPVKVEIGKPIEVEKIHKAVEVMNHYYEPIHVNIVK